MTDRQITNLLRTFGYGPYKKSAAPGLRTDPPKDIARLALEAAVKNLAAAFLYWRRGWADAQIASELGMTPAAVRQQLVRLRRLE